jgi:hypothetical protein
MARSGRLTLAAATFSCLALAVAVHPAAPSPNQSRQTRPGQSAVVTRWMPDLTCMLEGFKDSAGTMPLPPGGTVVSSGPIVSVFIRITVKNSSTTHAAKDFSVTFESSSGWPPHSMLPLATVGPGETRVYPLARFDYSAASAKVKVTGKADSPNRVKESNENNNTCTFEFTEQTTH